MGCGKPVVGTGAAFAQPPSSRLPLCVVISLAFNALVAFLLLRNIPGAEKCPDTGVP